MRSIGWKGGFAVFIHTPIFTLANLVGALRGRQSEQLNEKNIPTLSRVLAIKVFGGLRLGVSFHNRRFAVAVRRLGSPFRRRRLLNCIDCFSDTRGLGVGVPGARVRKEGRP